MEVGKTNGGELDAGNVKAIVGNDGRITFCDKNGRILLQEAKNGKVFTPFRVPERELGLRNPATGVDAEVRNAESKVRNAWTWHALFESPADEAFYGLGQHQAEELNMKGKNEDLFQYNTKVSVPFVVSNRGYGILWDSYSYCRFGNQEEYLQLNKAFKL